MTPPIHTNVEVLKDLGILEDIRGRTEWSDDEINAASSDRLLIELSVWELGSDWWTHFKEIYDALQKAN